ncbi:MAG: hypothetical protein U0736_16855 [Gemmataceae bacterium]
MKHTLNLFAHVLDRARRYQHSSQYHLADTILHRLFAFRDLPADVAEQADAAARRGYLAPPPVPPGSPPPAPPCAAGRCARYYYLMAAGVAPRPERRPRPRRPVLPPRPAAVAALGAVLDRGRIARRRSRPV